MVRGLGLEDLHHIYREEYLHAIELIRAQHDPGIEWNAFVEALFPALIGIFGLDVAGATDALAGDPPRRTGC